MRRRDTAPQTGRRAAREFAFRVLFESAQGGASLQDTLARAERAARDEADDAYARIDDETLAFARSLALAFDEKRDEVDRLLQNTIVGWTFSQMAQTDLNVLRLAATELLTTDTPPPAVIESAVRVARKFGGDESGRFVNGVLGSLQRAMKGEGA